MAHPLKCRAVASARLKNDKVDARTLAHLLRTDLLPEAWLAPKETRELRSLLRHRFRLARLSAHLKNRVHAVHARIARRRGKHVATVAVARKLMARSYHVLKEVNQEHGENVLAG